MLGSEALNMGQHLRRHGFVESIIDRHATITLGKRNDPHRQRSPRADSGIGRASARRLGTPEEHDGGRAPANIEEDDAVGPGIHQWRAADGGEFSLRLAIDDLEIESDLALYARPEFGPIRSRPAGFRSDQPR